jgi:nucleotide-binding universal stress UspA family protein
VIVAAMLACFNIPQGKDHAMSTNGFLIPAKTTATKDATCHVTACLDRPDGVDHIVRHAFTLGKALAAPVTLFQVLDGQQGQVGCPDPIEWDLRRHEARRSLGHLAAAPEDPTWLAEIRLAEGKIGEEICRFTHEQPGGLLVLGTRDGRDPQGQGIGGTILNILQRASGSVLLVPSSAPPMPDSAYHHILVPVDGSPWAESVIPLAARLARAHDAELLLAHVVPSPELTEARPYEAADLELRRQVVERNARAARAYLDRLRSNIAALGLQVRVLSVQGDDVRATLCRMICNEHADLVVLSARGHGLSSHTDMPYGSVTGYLASHCPAPILIVRPEASNSVTAARRQDLRLPDLASV